MKKLHATGQKHISECTEINTDKRQDVKTRQRQDNCQ